MELLVAIYQNRISMMGIFGNGDRNGNNEKNPALNWYFYRVLKRYEWPFVEIGVGDTLNSISLLVVADALSLIRLQAQLNYTKDEERKERRKFLNSCFYMYE